MRRQCGGTTRLHDHGEDASSAANAGPRGEDGSEAGVRKGSMCLTSKSGPQIRAMSSLMPGREALPDHLQSKDSHAELQEGTETMHTQSRWLPHGRRALRRTETDRFEVGPGSTNEVKAIMLQRQAEANLPHDRLKLERNGDGGTRNVGHRAPSPGQTRRVADTGSERGIRSLGFGSSGKCRAAKVWRPKRADRLLGHVGTGAEQKARQRREKWADASCFGWEERRRSRNA